MVRATIISGPCGRERRRRRGGDGIAGGGARGAECDEIGDDRDDDRDQQGSSEPSRKARGKAFWGSTTSPAL